MANLWSTAQSSANNYCKLSNFRSCNDYLNCKTQVWLIINMKLTQAQQKAIKEFAMTHYKSLDLVHGTWHMRKTVSNAKRLWEKEGGNWEIIEAGAYLHQFHDGEKVADFLEKIKVHKGTAKEILHCVECAHPKQIHRAKTNEAKIVYDADKLQWRGISGFISELFCNIFTRKKSVFEAIRSAQKVEFDSFSTLQTETGKRLGAPGHKILELLSATEKK